MSSFEHPSQEPRSDFVRLVDRRDVLAGGLFAGAALVLAGCQSSQPAVASNELPGPVWPDNEHPPLSPLPNTTPSNPGTASPGVSNSYGLPTNVIARSTWTRQSVIRSLANPMNGVNRITIHHDAIPSQNLRTQSDAVARLNSVRQSHIKEGWADIGYHYVIDPQGRVWEGRPLTFQGAHVKDHNEHNIGVMCMGNFEQQRPTSNQIASLDGFVGVLMRRHRIPVNRVYTHREIMPTACPGRNLQGYMLATRGRGGRLAAVIV
ncbi:MAG: peptidoglycan recognition protein family protein [Phycisphaerales bacterium]|nr:peptidoglycan recognition protein family protein [Phycisphaerales bacterium]